MATQEAFDIVAFHSDEFARVGFDGVVRSSTSERAARLWAERPRVVTYAYCTEDVIDGSTAFTRRMGCATFDGEPDEYLAALAINYLYDHGFAVRYR